MKFSHVSLPWGRLLYINHVARGLVFPTHSTQQLCQNRGQEPLGIFGRQIEPGNHFPQWGYLLSARVVFLDDI